MTDLIARLEAATEGSEELDRAIADAVLRRLTEGQRAGRMAVGWDVDVWIGFDGQVVTIKQFHPTRNLDAALTLIPPRWDVMEADSNGSLWCIVLGRGDSGHPDYREVVSWPGDHERRIFHRKPPALALCISALKAGTL